jgi:carbon-monoxide dehydrogenase large subunit
VAHARITGIDTSAAADEPDVIAVLTAEDFANLKYFPANAFHPLVGDGGFKPAARPAIAGDRMRFVGEIVAMVIANSRASAEAAAEMVLVDYDELPVAMAWDGSPDAVDLHDDIPANVAMDVGFGHEAELVRAFSEAACSRRSNRRTAAGHRQSDGAAQRHCNHDAATGRYHLWAPHQGVPEMQTVLAACPGRFARTRGDRERGRGRRIRCSRRALSRARALMAAAKLTGQTLAWQGQRVEGFMSDAQGRGNRLTGKLALNSDGVSGNRCCLRSRSRCLCDTRGRAHQSEKSGALHHRRLSDRSRPHAGDPALYQRGARQAPIAALAVQTCPAWLNDWSTRQQR